MKKSFDLSMVLDFFGITVGAAIAAFAIEEFLVPCTILDGGIVGVSIIISAKTGFQLSVLTVLLNIPFLITGARKMGRKFIIRSAWAMGVFSAALELFAPMNNITTENLLAVCYGGVFLGIGVGIVIRCGGCLDGTETVAILLNKKYNLPVGRTVLMFNIFIYSAAGFIFDFDRAMYSLLTYFITSKVLDIVESGMNKTKAAMIITNDPKDIAEKIYKRLGRTITIMEGEGLVSGKKTVLYCVLTMFEINELKEIIQSTDASSFIAISDVSEIIGKHIKSSSGLKKTEENGSPQEKPEAVQTKE